MLLGTRMTNNEPHAVRDTDVVARYDATDPDYVIKDSSNRISALLDKSKRLQLSAILNSGNLIVNKVYVIVSTTSNYFGAGLVNTNMFVASSTLALSDDNSVREVLDNHITQTNTAKMPIHTNRYNLLTYSEDYSNSAWIKQTSTVIPNQTIAPDGTMTASLLYPNESGSYRGIRQQCSLNNNLVTSLYCKAQNKTLIGFFTYDSKRTVIDLTTGQIVNTNNINTKFNIVNVGNDWFRISLVYNAINGVSNAIYVYIVDDIEISTTATIANGTDGIFIWGAQVEQSNFAGKYQRINSATDYDTNGFEYYAQFDGVDDYLKSLPFTLNQPTSIYSCLKQDSWTDTDRIWDGFNDNNCSLLQRINVGNLRIFAGVVLDNSTKNTVGSYDNICVQYSYPSISSIKINNLSKINGQVGAFNLQGFTLGAGAVGNLNSHISVKEIIIKSIATDESDTIFNFFKNKHKVIY